MERYSTFQDAFVDNISTCYNVPDEISTSRNGDQYEIIGYSYKVEDPSSFVFENQKVGRIPYSYAEDFYEWMMSGCGEKATEEFKLKYKNNEKFLSKPKSEHLPDNFNTFYGPRILRQLPAVLKELETKENSRRAVINILNEDDQLLLDSDETLEYPCADSATLLIRRNKLHLHLHMRSNNMGNVSKLDMYLWGRFQCEIADKLNVELGNFTSSVVSAHIFESDFKYFEELGIINLRHLV